MKLFTIICLLGVALAEHAPELEYLPPVQEAHIATPSNEYLAPAAEQNTVLANDGYRYRTVRRFRNRIRREIGGHPSSEYLPPIQGTQNDVPAPSNEYNSPSNEYLAPVASDTVLANDGYRYKTIRRFRSRVRRDVSELPNQEYLPPVQAPSNEYLAPAFEEQTQLADDGYRYKTVKKFKIRRH